MDQGWDRQYPARIGTYMYKPGIDGFSKVYAQIIFFFKLYPDTK